MSTNQVTALKAQIDHVVITVSDKLDQANEQYKKLGFTMTSRGHHSMGTSNNLAIFTTTYLELLGYEVQNADKVDASWRFDNGLTGLVFKTNDSETLYRSLITQGVKVDGDKPKAFFRPVELPDGSISEARFKTVRLDPSYTPNGQIFFCDQLTPENVWQKEWQQHENGVTEIIGMVIEARDPASSITLLQKTFPQGKITWLDEGLRFQAEDKTIDYLTPKAVVAKYGDALTPANNHFDRKVALILKVKSLAETKAVFTKNTITYLEQDKTLIVPAQETFGVVLIFTQG